MCGDGAVWAAEATAPQRDRYEIEITGASDGHRKNSELGNAQPSWKRTGMGRGQEYWVPNTRNSAPLLPF